MRKKLYALLTCVLILALLLTGCNSNSDISVAVQSVSMITGIGSVGMYDKYAGVVESGDTINVEKNEDMELQDIKVSVGDTVSIGEILFTYNTDAISLELEKQELELEQLKNSITTKNSQITVLEKEKASASSDSKLDYTLQIQALQVEVKEAEINVTSKEKEIERTRATLEHSEVTSTVNGTVKTVNTEGNTDPNTGLPLPFISITQAGDYRVKGIINEQNAYSLAEGTPVIIRSRVGDDSWTGSITMVDFEHPAKKNDSFYYYDSGDEMTTSTNYPFYITLDDDSKLMLGQHVYIEPDLGQDSMEGFFLPANYIVNADSKPYVWAANSHDKLEKRQIKIGTYDEDLNSYKILDGLSLSDYIADPGEDCREGVSVTYYDEDSFGGDMDLMGDDFIDDIENDGELDFDGMNDAGIIGGSDDADKNDVTDGDVSDLNSSSTDVPMGETEGA